MIKKRLAVLLVANISCTLLILASLLGCEGFCNWMIWKILMIVSYFITLAVVICSTGKKKPLYFLAAFFFFLIALWTWGRNLKKHEEVAYGIRERTTAEQALDMICYYKDDENAGHRTIIAIIDTKYDLSEIEEGELWTNEGEVPDNGIDDDGNGYVDDMNGWNFIEEDNRIQTDQLCSHGTMILNGIDDFGLKIMPIVILDEEGDGATNSIVEAIKYAEENGADICNLSIASYEDNQEVEKAIHQSHMLFIVSAGNEGEELNAENKCYPACYDEDNLITVAACDTDYNITEESNYGNAYIDIAAPGDCIGISLVNGVNTIADGTSYAAALATRGAALIWNRAGSEYSAKDMKQLLLNTVTRKESLSGKVGTSGIINIDEAIKTLEDALSKR